MCGQHKRTFEREIPAITIPHAHYSTLPRDDHPFLMYNRFTETTDALMTLNPQHCHHLNHHRRRRHLSSSCLAVKKKDVKSHVYCQDLLLHQQPLPHYHLHHYQHLDHCQQPPLLVAQWVAPDTLIQNPPHHHHHPHRNPSPPLEPLRSPPQSLHFRLPLLDHARQSLLLYSPTSQCLKVPNPHLHPPHPPRLPPLPRPPHRHHPRLPPPPHPPPRYPQSHAPQPHPRPRPPHLPHQSPHPNPHPRPPHTPRPPHPRPPPAPPPPQPPGTHSTIHDAAPHAGHSIHSHPSPPHKHHSPHPHPDQQPHPHPDHQHHRYYRPPSTSDDDEEDNDDVDEQGTVFSQVGLAESVVPRPERFRPKRAAVLICLFEGEGGELRVILTKRSSKLSTHSGEVALPGGKAEEGDADDTATATREAKEEIGLDPELVTVVTVLQPFLSKHLLRVIPVIGILSNKQAFRPVANADEVETIFDAPLEMFLKDENRRWEEREWTGSKFLVHYFDFETENNKFVIWGLTAGILVRAASVVYQRPPSFVEQNPKLKIPKVINSQTLLP